MTYWLPRTTDPYAPPPTATSAWPQWTVTTDTGWRRESPRMRLRLRKCRRLRRAE